jgi:hypothetical protein
MNAPMKLVKLTVIDNATQKNVSRAKNWAAVKNSSASVIVEATTSPNNTLEEWKLIQWAGGEVVQGKANHRKISLAISRKHHVEAKLGGVGDFIDLWVLWATAEILTKGTRPKNAAPFDHGIRDDTDKLGAVTFESLTSSVVDEKAGVFVNNRGASGKVAAAATLSPSGVNSVVKAGWTFEREVWSHNWIDGVKALTSNEKWTPDTSKPNYLRLTPDGDDKIYDLDGPDLRWGNFHSETYNNFRQWVTWNGEKCSEYALWHWQARWSVNKDPSKQITLNECGTGNIMLPKGPHFPAHNAR